MSTKVLRTTMTYSRLHAIPSEKKRTISPSTSHIPLCHGNRQYMKKTPLQTAIYSIPQYIHPTAIAYIIAIAYLCIAFRENPMRRTLFHAKNSHMVATPKTCMTRGVKAGKAPGQPIRTGQRRAGCPDRQQSLQII